MQLGTIAMVVFQIPEVAVVVTTGTMTTTLLGIGYLLRTETPVAHRVNRTSDSGVQTVPNTVTVHTICDIDDASHTYPCPQISPLLPSDTHIRELVIYFQSNRIPIGGERVPGLQRVGRKDLFITL